MRGVYALLITATVLCFAWYGYLWIYYPIAIGEELKGTFWFATPRPVELDEERTVGLTNLLYGMGMRLFSGIMAVLGIPLLLLNSAWAAFALRCLAGRPRPSRVVDHPATEDH